jgi:uncharacterized protein YkwD
MRSSILFLGLALLCLALPAIAVFGAASATNKVYLPLVACPGCPAPTSPGDPQPDPDAYEAEAIRLINEIRAAVGCPAAVVHPVLMQATEDWSTYMSLTSEYRHAPPDFYSEEPYFYNQAIFVENIGSGGHPELAVQGWLLSPPHRQNMEYCIKPGQEGYDPNITYDIGIGFAANYWTLVIGVRR